MKKKVFLIVRSVIILMVVGIIILKKTELKENQHNEKINDLVIMVQNGSDYVKQDDVPVGSNYSLNDKKTYCENGGIIKDYDAVNGAVKYVVTGSDKCTLYFDVKSKPVLLDFSPGAVASRPRITIYDSKITAEVPIKYIYFQFNDLGYEKFEYTIPENDYMAFFYNGSYEACYNMIDDSLNTAKYDVYIEDEEGTVSDVLSKTYKFTKSNTEHC